MTNLESALAGIEQMTSKALWGPWRVDPATNNDVLVKLIHNGTSSVALTTHPEQGPDAEFIAASRTLIPALVKALRAAIKQRDFEIGLSKMDSESRDLQRNDYDSLLAAILANGREGE